MKTSKQRQKLYRMRQKLWREMYLQLIAILADERQPTFSTLDETEELLKFPFGDFSLPRRKK